MIATAWESAPASVASAATRIRRSPGVRLVTDPQQRETLHGRARKTIGRSRASGRFLSATRLPGPYPAAASRACESAAKSPTLAGAGAFVYAVGSPNGVRRDPRFAKCTQSTPKHEGRPAISWTLCAVIPDLDRGSPIKDTAMAEVTSRQRRSGTHARPRGLLGYLA